MNNWIKKGKFTFLLRGVELNVNLQIEKNFLPQLNDANFACFWSQSKTFQFCHNSELLLLNTCILRFDSHKMLPQITCHGKAALTHRNCRFFCHSNFELFLSYFSACIKFIARYFFFLFCWAQFHSLLHNFYYWVEWNEKQKVL